MALKVVRVLGMVSAQPTLRFTTGQPSPLDLGFSVAPITFTIPIGNHIPVGNSIVVLGWWTGWRPGLLPPPAQQIDVALKNPFSPGPWTGPISGSITDTQGNSYVLDWAYNSTTPYKSIFGCGIARTTVNSALQGGDIITFHDGWTYGGCILVEVVGLVKSNRFTFGYYPGPVPYSPPPPPYPSDPIVQEWSQQQFLPVIPTSVDPPSLQPTDPLPVLIFGFDLQNWEYAQGFYSEGPPWTDAVGWPGSSSPGAAWTSLGVVPGWPGSSPGDGGLYGNPPFGPDIQFSAFYRIVNSSTVIPYARTTAGSGEPLDAGMLAYEHGPSTGVACLCQKTQEFIVARPDSDGNDLDVLKSDTIVPPFTNTTVLTGLIEPALDVEFSPSRVLRLLAVDPTGAVVQRRSFDDSESFTEASQVFPAGANPRIRSSRKGHILYAAYIDSGSGIGTISGILQENPNAPLGTPFQFLDKTNSALTFNNTGFDFSYTFEPVERLLMVAQPAGATEYETYQSCDDGQTWIILGT